MSLPVELWQLSAAACALFFGSALQGVAGFGMGLFALPVILRTLPREAVVPLMTALAWGMNAQIFWKLRRDAERGLYPAVLRGG